jgi:hypothetical protein
MFKRNNTTPWAALLLLLGVAAGAVTLAEWRFSNLPACPAPKQRVLGECQ